MKPRIEYQKIAPAAFQAMRAFETYVRSCGLEPTLLELIKIRSSQINGCAYCLDMHTKDARAQGETEQRAKAAACEIPFVLNVRVDLYLHGAGDEPDRFAQVVQRAKAYRDAGADCVFPIGLKDRETIARLVSEIGCPLNIMAGPSAPTIAELEQLGVRRVTFGTGLMRATLPLIRQMAQELRASGGCDSLAQTEFTHAVVNQLFRK